MSSLIVKSPSKINLHLRVVGRYPDGYHQLVTLFHRISLADTLRLKKVRKGFTLECSDPSLPADETNLVTRAYRALQKKFPGLGGVKVFLRKRIPVSGGLGGGSGNAAAFLLGMKRLYQLPLSLKELVSMGGKLGADVPFYLHNMKQGLGLGRGDTILPMPLRSKLWFLLILFPKGLSTKLVYENLKTKAGAVSLTKEKRTVKIACNLLDCKDFRQTDRVLKNDLQPVATRFYPAIQKVIHQVARLGVPLVRMSGSGPTVFAVFSQQKEAQRLKALLKKQISSERMIVCYSF